MITDDLTEFAKRYAKAWCSQNPDSVAAFYAENGSLSVNDGPPAVGRAAIAKEAQAFMTTFPDMVVTFDKLDPRGDATAEQQPRRGEPHEVEEEVRRRAASGERRGPHHDAGARDPHLHPPARGCIEPVFKIA